MQIPFREALNKVKEEVTAAGATNNGAETPEHVVGSVNSNRQATNWRSDSKAKFAKPGIYNFNDTPENGDKLYPRKEADKKVKKLKEALNRSSLAKSVMDKEPGVDKWAVIPEGDTTKLTIEKVVLDKKVRLSLVISKDNTVDGYIGPLCFQHNIIAATAADSVDPEKGARIVKALMKNIQEDFDDFLRHFGPAIEAVLKDYALEDISVEGAKHYRESVKEDLESIVEKSKLPDYSDDFEILTAKGNKVYVVANKDNTEDVSWRDYEDNIRHETGLRVETESVDENDPAITDLLAERGYDSENDYVVVFNFPDIQPMRESRRIKYSKRHLRESEEGIVSVSFTKQDETSVEIECDYSNGDTRTYTYNIHKAIGFAKRLVRDGLVCKIDGKEAEPSMFDDSNFHFMFLKKNGATKHSKIEPDKSLAAIVERADIYGDYDVLTTKGNKVYVVAHRVHGDEVEISTEDVSWKDYEDNIKAETGLRVESKPVDSQNPAIADLLDSSNFDPENDYLMVFVFSETLKESRKVKHNARHFREDLEKQDWRAREILSALRSLNWDSESEEGAAVDALKTFFSEVDNPNERKSIRDWVYECEFVFDESPDGEFEDDLENFLTKIVNGDSENASLSLEGTEFAEDHGWVDGDEHNKDDDDDKSYSDDFERLLASYDYTKEDWDSRWRVKLYIGFKETFPSLKHQRVVGDAFLEDLLLSRPSLLKKVKEDIDGMSLEQVKNYIKKNFSDWIKPEDCYNKEGKASLVGLAFSRLIHYKEIDKKDYPQFKGYFDEIENFGYYGG